MEVRNVSTRPAVTCSPSTSLAEAAHLMQEHNVGCLVVVRHGVMSGVVTDRDIVTRGIAEGRPLSSPVDSLMSSDVAFVFEADDVESAATLMASRGFRRLPVLNVHGTVMGMLSLDDLMSQSADQVQKLAFTVRSELRQGKAEALRPVPHRASRR